MIPGTLARRYARALMGLAEDSNLRDSIAEQLEQVSDAIQQQDEDGSTIVSVLASDRYPIAQRTHLLEAVAKRISAHEILVKFMVYVLERGRIKGLAQMAHAYQKLVDDIAGRLQATIKSAQPLSESTLSALQTSLQQATNKTIVIHTEVDPELIGGVVAHVGGYVLDGSVRAQLDTLRTTLTHP